MKKYIIYIVMIVLSIVIRICDYFGSAFANEILNDISIGVLTSTLVALLIEISADKREKEKTNRLRLQLFYPFWDVLIKYMNDFCFYSCYSPKEYQNFRKSFLDWTAFYCERCKENEFDIIDKKRLLAYSNQISEEARKITSNKVWMLHESIITLDDIKLICDIESVINRYNIYTIGDQIRPEAICDINKDLSKIPELKSLMELEYGYDYRIDKLFKKAFLNKYK